MATSKIILYRTELTPERNAVIDDLQDYLLKQSIKTYEADKFQYLKIQINQEITIAESQDKVGNQTLGNYCDVFQDNRHYYYFVLNAKWISSNAVRLTLSLDTLNTFRDKIEFTSQTTIQREHRDRFKSKDEFNFNKEVGNKDVYSVIDRQPEGLPVIKVQDSSTIIKDNNIDDLDWYLIYKTRDDLSKENIANPISCMLVADKPLLLQKGFVDLPKQVFNSPSFMEPGKYYFLDWQNNPNYKIGIGEGGAGSKDTLIFVLTIKDGKIALGNRSYKKIGGSYSLQDTSPINVINTPNRVTFYQSNKLMISNYPLENYTDIVNLQNFLPMQTGTLEDKKTIAFKEVDKTDSKLMKIIRLPYCPIEITKDSDGIYHYPDNWEFKNGYLVLKSYNLSEEFINNISSVVLDEYLKKNIYVNPYSHINSSYETKLLNSEFFTYKFVYDSFVKEIRLEDVYFSNVDEFEPTPIKLDITFKPTNTVNSKIAFKFDFESPEVNYLLREDYEQYLIATRNNEETIFSNDYINYIRNGINYDKKARTLGVVGSVFGVGSSIAHSGATAAIGKYQAGRDFDASWGGKSDLFNVRSDMRRVFVNQTASPILSASAVSAGFNAINGLVGAVTSYQQATDNINRKLEELSMQSTVVKGADDVDLLKFYNNNRLELKTYNLDPNNARIISQLFYYTGYNHPYQEKPDLTSRYWFNYIKCTPVFENENTSVYVDYIDDIKARFEKGVTIFHHHPELDIEWNLEQNKENWETSLLDTTYLPNSPIPGLRVENITLDTRIPNVPKLSWTIPFNAPLEEYEIFEVKYKNKSGYINKMETRYTSTNLPLWDGESNIYMRRKYIFKENLSSPWEVVYSVNRS